MKKKIDDNIYVIRKNNYFGLLFFALVLASLLYIIKDKTTPYKELEPITNEIITMKDQIDLEYNDLVKDLMNYQNMGDANTFKIYQSMYNKEEVTIDNLDNETLLYIAYKYLTNEYDTTKYNKYLTCSEAEQIGIQNRFSKCSNGNENITDYQVNTYITKDKLTKTINKLFNINLETYTNFYTTYDNLCYYINNEYLCVSKNKATNNKIGEKEFIKASQYKDRIEIIEKYKYLNDNIYFKYFNSNEVGDQLYITTYKKINGSYYFYSTKPYQEN